MGWAGLWAMAALCVSRISDGKYLIGISSLWVPLFVAQSDFRPLTAKPGMTRPPTYENQANVVPL